jgi:hypothetical protein
VPARIPSQPLDPWAGYICIRTSLEYQLLDGIRQRLGLGPGVMEAPAFELEVPAGKYIRHCRLLARQRSLAGLDLPRPLYLGLDLGKQAIEIYMTNCLRVTWKGNIKRDTNHNWVYVSASLLDEKNLTGRALRESVRVALLRSGAAAGIPTEPLFRRRVEYPTVGPYVLGDSTDDLG